MLAAKARRNTDMKAERVLRRGRSRHWERVFRGVGPGEDNGRYWTPEPLAALTFAKRYRGRLIVGTLRLRGLEFCRLDDWDGDAPHLGDGPPPRDGTDIQYYCDRAQQAILWHSGENRCIDDGETYGPEVLRIHIPRFKTYRLISEKALRSLKRAHCCPYSNELVAAVLASSGTSAL